LLVVHRVSRSLVGTRYALCSQQRRSDYCISPSSRLTDSKLAFETSEYIPEPEVVSTHLRALGERGVLERFDGALIGRASARSHVEDNPSEWRENYRERQRDAIAGVFETYNPDAPVVFDCEFGHTYPTCPIPIGGEVEIAPSTKSIHLR
jgi:muramoyltetrapeptide carboxypeptidase LdcA involved in peptidoglycan recycling